MFKVGGYRIIAIEADRFRLDGGAMFGVVPKTLWSRQHAADERNRIRMVTRCLLARGEGRVVLIDTGLGGGWSEKERAMYGIEDDGHPLMAALETAGVGASDVTDVVLTHLHFDHAGGAVLWPDDPEGDSATPVVAFPEARFHVQAEQLAWAERPSERDRRSFRADTLGPLVSGGRLAPTRGAAEILPGIHVEPTRGHTPGHQVVRVGEGRGCVVYCGDLIPTAAHLPGPWVMGYDLQPLLTMKEKHDVLSRAAEQEWILVLDHDPVTPALRVVREGDGFAADSAVAL